MKMLKKAIGWIIGVVALLVILAFAFDVDYLFKAVRTVYFNGHVTAFLDDYQYFDNRKIEADKPQPWYISSLYNKAKPSDALEGLHRQTETVAYLIIRNDSILHETYLEGYHKDSISNSFSMAKSIVSAALGRAIMDGKIKSLDQPVTDFFPEFKGEYRDKLTVGDLSSMSSGLNWDENYYSPFSITTRAYFDDDLTSTMLKLRVEEEPGKFFKYLSGNTQLLAMVLEKATGMPIPEYVSEKFWKPMGAETTALWQTDRDGGIVKAYCCIASNARDFARFGKLYLNHGNWNGVQLLDSAFVARSVVPRFPESPQYGYGWWLGEFDGKKLYFMRGHLGQYTIVVPQDRLIIVRLGKSSVPGDAANPKPQGFLKFVAGAYDIIKQTDD